MSEQTANLCTTDAAEAMRETIADQAREIERLSKCKRFESQYHEAERELSALKAQPSGVVLPELRTVVTDAFMGMIAAVTSTTPPADQPPPPFIQSAIDRAVDRIARLNSSPVSAGESFCEYCGGNDEEPQDHCMDCTRPVSAGVVDERAAFEAWYLGHFYMGDKQCGLEWLSTEPCGGYRHQHPAEQWKVWQARAALTASAPNHSEQVRELPPFAQKVISKLKRFEECASDSDAGGVDIGRHWLDLLTQLGLLNRVQRSPGLWEISQQGEDVLAAAPSSGSQEQGE